MVLSVLGLRLSYRQKTEDRKQKTEGQKAENRKQKTERQKAEDRRQKTENRKQNRVNLIAPLFLCHLSSVSLFSALHPNPQCISGKNRLSRVFSFGNATSVASKQSKSNTIRIVCVNFVSYRLFGGGRGRLCLNSRSRRPPPSPHPKKFIKIGLRPIAWTAIFAAVALRIGA